MIVIIIWERRWIQMFGWDGTFEEIEDLNRARWQIL
jgi:hypothetical protein